MVSVPVQMVLILVLVTLVVVPKQQGELTVNGKKRSDEAGLYSTVLIVYIVLMYLSETLQYNSQPNHHHNFTLVVNGFGGTHIVPLRHAPPPLPGNGEFWRHWPPSRKISTGPKPDIHNLRQSNPARQHWQKQEKHTR